MKNEKIKAFTGECKKVDRTKKNFSEYQQPRLRL